MRVLVTGGAGFIGSHVVDRLLAAGHAVAVLDKARAHVARGARYFKADVAEIGRALEEKTDAVMHLAGQINVRVSVQDPIRDARENILGTIGVLGACVERGVRRFIFASSGGAIHGDQRRYPCGEGIMPHPTSPYGISKLAAELYAAWHGRLEVVTLRIANAYGPRQDPRSEAAVVAIFMKLMREGRTPVIYGDGRQTRDYVYVEDVARAFVSALKGRPGTYNVGTGVEVSVRKLFGAIKKILKFPGEPKFAAGLAGEVRRSALDPALAKRALGWAPKVGLEEGLKRTMDGGYAQVPLSLDR